jgi:putative membrane protein
VIAVDEAQRITPDVSTRLAFDRTRVAYDRTMMAWIRTAASLITFGFTVFKFFQLEVGGARQDKHLIGPREFALSMVGIGLISLVLGAIEYHQNMRSLRLQWPSIPRSQIGVLAALISALGILALIAVIFRK